MLLTEIKRCPYLGKLPNKYVLALFYAFSLPKNKERTMNKFLPNYLIETKPIYKGLEVSKALPNTLGYYFRVLLIVIKNSRS